MGQQKPANSMATQPHTAGPLSLSFRDQTFSLLGHAGQTQPAGLCLDSETTAWTPQPHIQCPASWP